MLICLIWIEDKILKAIPNLEVLDQTTLDVPNPSLILQSLKKLLLRLLSWAQNPNSTLVVASLNTFL